MLNVSCLVSNPVCLFVLRYRSLFYWPPGIIAGDSRHGTFAQLLVGWMDELGVSKKKCM